MALLPGSIPNRDFLYDPATGYGYNFDVNHQTEQAFGKQRNIERTARTGFVGMVRQQGDDGPLLIQLKGEYFKRDQHRNLWHFYNLCKTQTVYWQDFAGDQYEVQITHFLPVRTMTAKNMRDDTAPYHYYTYDMELDVVTILAGDMLTEGISL